MITRKNWKEQAKQSRVLSQNAKLSCRLQKVSFYFLIRKLNSSLKGKGVRHLLNGQSSKALRLCYLATFQTGAVEFKGSFLFVWWVLIFWWAWPVWGWVVMSSCWWWSWWLCHKPSPVMTMNWVTWHNMKCIAHFSWTWDIVYHCSRAKVWRKSP